MAVFDRTSNKNSLTMKHITILIPKNAILGSIEGPRQLLTGVNNYYASLGKPPMFKVELAGITKETALVNGTYTITTQRTIDQIDKTDLVIIPAVDGDPAAALKSN